MSMKHRSVARQAHRRSAASGGLDGARDDVRPAPGWVAPLQAGDSSMGRPPVLGRELTSIQRVAGNAAVSELLSRTARKGDEARSAGSGGGPLAVQRFGPPEVDRPYKVPDAMTAAAIIGDYRSISDMDMVALNDDQLLDLKGMMDSWWTVFDGSPELMYDAFKRARQKSERKQSYDLFLESAKIERAFLERYKPVSDRARVIARKRSFTFSDSELAPPKLWERSLFEVWSDEIEGGLAGAGKEVYRNMLPMVTRRLELLLWDGEVPEAPTSEKGYWMKYGYWGSNDIINTLTATDKMRRTTWEDFAPSLLDAAAQIADAFFTAIRDDGGPSTALNSILGVIGEITAGMNAIRSEGDPPLAHGDLEVNIRDLYEWAKQMRDTRDSVMSSFPDSFPFR